MKKVLSHTRGFLIVEVALAAAIFSMFAMTYFGASLYGVDSTLLAGQRARAALLAEQGMQAVRNIRDEDFENLVDGTYGLVESGGQWMLSGTEDVTDIFTRHIDIETIDDYRKEVVSTVVWQQSTTREGSLSIEGKLTDWQRSVATSSP